MIRSRIRSLAAQERRASAISFPVTGAIVFVLWLMTILVSDAPWFVVTPFWVIVGGAIALWVHRDMRTHGSHLEGMKNALESALRRNAADVYDVRATSFAELEEIEDEGACYAFSLDDNRLLFVTGQEFYEGAKFPSLDFSLVYPVDESGRAVDMLIDKRGARTTPARIIPAAIKKRLDVPQHLEVRAGRIDDLENIVGRDEGRMNHAT